MLDFFLLAQQCAPTVAPQTIAAVVKHESGFRPNAIGINRAGRLQRQPRNQEEAVVTAEWLIKNGYNIDMGLGQINSANLRRLGLTVKDVFDPCTNLRAAAQILSENYNLASRSYADPQKRLHVALSYYNTGSPTRGFSNGYVSKVMAHVPAMAKQAGTVVTAAPAVTPIPLARAGMLRPKATRIARVKPPAQAVPAQPNAATAEAGVVQLEREQPPSINVYNRQAQLDVYSRSGV